MLYFRRVFFWKFVIFYPEQNAKFSFDHASGHLTNFCLLLYRRWWSMFKKHFCYQWPFRTWHYSHTLFLKIFNQKSVIVAPAVNNYVVIVIYFNNDTNHQPKNKKNFINICNNCLYFLLWGIEFLLFIICMAGMLVMEFEEQQKEQSVWLVCKSLTWIIVFWERKFSNISKKISVAFHVCAHHLRKYKLIIILVIK